MDKKNFSRLFISICFMAFLFGCVTTKPVKPNNPYLGHYPAKFNKISDKNLLLAEEIGKLPELQDGISEKENMALLQLVKLYEKHPSEFDDAFDEMYKVGLPGIRKYCTPLQALFWLAEDNILKEEFIVNYVLPVLLNYSWKEKTRLTNDQILDVIEDLKNEDLKKMLSGFIKNGFKEDAIKIIMEKYKNNSSLFSKSAQKKIKNFDISDPRWNDMDSIYDRLNAPVLFDYYVNNNIIYNHIFPSYHRPPTAVIKEKFGDCDDLAYFGKIVLSKAGYDLIGRFYNKEATINHIILGIKLEDGSYFKAVDFSRRGNIMGGPYKTVLEMDQAAGYGRWYQTREAFSFHW